MFNGGPMVIDANDWARATAHELKAVVASHTLDPAIKAVLGV